MFPGKQYISEEAARALVLRGVAEEEAEEDNNNNHKKRFYFRHDQRLQWKTLQQFSVEQLDELYRDVKCPTCVLLGEDGWPVDEELQTRTKQVLNPTVFQTLPGSHHFHADPDNVEAVTNAIVSFIHQS